MRRIVLSGVESVGKSRLAADLAAHLGAPLVPEYGRTYCEGLARDLVPEDLHAIAAGHAAAAEQAPPAAHRIEDTDVVMTAAWARMLFGAPDPALAAPSPGLHLLLLPDVPFVPDRVRLFPDDARRLAFHAHIVAEYQARGLAYVPVGGTWPRRFARALAAINAWNRP